MRAASAVHTIVLGGLAFVGGCYRLGDLQAPSGASVALIGAPVTAHGQGAEVAVTLPAAIREGDLLLGMVLIDAEGGTPAPSGWTLDDSVDTGCLSHVVSLHKNATADDAGATVDFTATASGQPSMILVAAYAGNPQLGGALSRTFNTTAGAVPLDVPIPPAKSGDFSIVSFASIDQAGASYSISSGGRLIGAIDELYVFEVELPSPVPATVSITGPPPIGCGVARAANISAPDMREGT